MTSSDETGEPSIVPLPQQLELRDIDPLDPPAALLARYGARVLDPSTAAKLADENNHLTVSPRRTVYLADRLIVPARARNTVLDALPDRAGRGFDLVMPEVDARTRDDAMVVAQIISTKPGQAAPDAWSLVAEVRGYARVNAVDLSGVGLDHLLLACDPLITGTPGTQGLSGGSLDLTAAAEYARAGSGGRSPVTVLGAAPTRSGSVRGRPVVAILDTGLGDHPWLKTGVVAGPPGIGSGIADAEVSAVDTESPLVGAMPRCAGHGTFIAGIVRQLCPDANLMPIRIMRPDGVVIESELIAALTLLAEAAEAVPSGANRPDIVLLSLGYYHELDSDALTDALLLAPIERLAAKGVAVVASAGNDATTRPMYPAGFAALPPGTSAAAPVLSVGGLNPDRTVALYSNSAQWVRYWDSGVAIVSTFPVTFDGSFTPSVRMKDPVLDLRTTFDPDDFRQGFGTWSGTSFAAPVVAGKLARQLIANPHTVAGTVAAIAAMVAAPDAPRPTPAPGPTP